MRKIGYIFHIIAAVLLLAACTGDEMATDGGQSGFMLTLTGNQEVVTRMTPAELGTPAVDKFNVRITNNKTGRAVYDGAYKAFVNAGNGDYTLVATYGEDVELGLNAPYYRGEAQASITAADLKPSVNIPCRVANSLLSVRYLDREGNVSTECFDDAFSQYYVHVVKGSLSTDLLTERHTAYFCSGALPQLYFVGTLKDIGREVEFEIPVASLPAQLEAAEHLILCLSLEVKPSGVILEVTKAEVVNVTVEETIPLEWLPKPKVSAFNGTNRLNYVETTTPVDYAKIDFSTSHDLQDVELTFDFDDAALASINGTYRLSALTAQQAEVLATYGITMPQTGQTYTDGTIDLRGLVAQMRTDNGVQVDNRITMRLQANNRWNEQQFVVSAVRPVFNMSVQRQGFAWAHSLYVTPLTTADVVDAKGADKDWIADNVVFEISADGGATWSEITEQSDGYYYATGLAPATSYELRARLGEIMYSATTATATTETLTPVPNGDFETLKSSSISVSGMQQGGDWSPTAGRPDYKNYVTFTVKEPEHWATVNAKTCNTNAATKNSWFVVPSTYNTSLSWSAKVARIPIFHNEENVTPDIYKNLAAQSGKNAMVVRNVGWHSKGSTPSVDRHTTSSEYYNRKAPSELYYSAGKLFLGSYAYNNGAETYNEGISFADRPTQLNGYYKYTDNVSDETGTVDVKMYAGDVEIASGHVDLVRATSYTNFTVNLTYSDVVSKATSLRIMFASSNHASYNQQEENANIPTTNVISKYESIARGATLAIDNLTFTYDK